MSDQENGTQETACPKCGAVVTLAECRGGVVALSECLGTDYCPFCGECWPCEYFVRCPKCGVWLPSRLRDVVPVHNDFTAEVELKPGPSGWSECFGVGQPPDEFRKEERFKTATLKCPRCDEHFEREWFLDAMEPRERTGFLEIDNLGIVTPPHPQRVTCPSCGAEWVPTWEVVCSVCKGALLKSYSPFAVPPHADIARPVVCAPNGRVLDPAPEKTTHEILGSLPYE